MVPYSRLGRWRSKVPTFFALAISFLKNSFAIIEEYCAARIALINFCAIALALNNLECKATGIRWNSGVLGYLSQLICDTFGTVSNKYTMPSLHTLN